MKRYAYIEPAHNQLIFNEDKGAIDYIRKFRPDVQFIEQGIDEEATIKAFERKYGCNLAWKEIKDGEVAWKGYVIEDKEG